MLGAKRASKATSAFQCPPIFCFWQTIRGLRNTFAPAHVPPTPPSPGLAGVGSAVWGRVTVGDWLWSVFHLFFRWKSVCYSRALLWQTLWEDSLRRQKSICPFFWQAAEDPVSPTFSNQNKFTCWNFKICCLWLVDSAVILLSCRHHGIMTTSMCAFTLQAGSSCQACIVSYSCSGRVEDTVPARWLVTMVVLVIAPEGTLEIVVHLHPLGTKNYPLSTLN